MNKLMALALALNFGSAFAASWTNSAAIVTANIQQNSGSSPNKFSVTTSGVTSNTSGCSNPNEFIMDLNTEKQIQLQTMILAAHLHSRHVRFYVLDGGCNTWGAATIDGVEIEPN